MENHAICLALKPCQFCSEKPAIIFKEGLANRKVVEINLVEGRSGYGDWHYILKHSNKDCLSPVSLKAYDRWDLVKMWNELNS